jgi:hypothetical protein
MKKFIVMILAVATFFVGLGGLVESVGAKFKSDEKALELIRRARLAIGGDAAIESVRSMTIQGKVTKTFDVEGSARSEQGEVEINLELSGKMNKSLRIGNAPEGANLAQKRVEMVVIDKADADNVKFRVEKQAAPAEGNGTFVLKRRDGATEDITIDGKEPIILSRADSEKATFSVEDGKTVVVRKADVINGAGNSRQHELARTTLALLLNAPEGLDIAYKYAGEGSVDGAACDIVEAQIAGASVKLYLDRASSLPRMMSYQGVKPIAIRVKKDENGEGETKTFIRQMPNNETVEFQVKFSDYRSVNGLQLPFLWTQTVAGKADEMIEVTNYEINPANISEKFKDVPQKIIVRSPKQQ